MAAKNKKAIIGELCHRRSRPEMHPASLFILIWLAREVSWTLIALWSGRTEKRHATWNVWTYGVLVLAGAARSSSHTARLERLASNECGMSICRCLRPGRAYLGRCLLRLVGANPSRTPAVRWHHAQNIGEHGASRILAHLKNRQLRKSLVGSNPTPLRQRVALRLPARAAINRPIAHPNRN